MESSKSTPLKTFKSKKPFLSDQKSWKPSESDPKPLSVKTPGKSADPPRRSRYPSAALSIKEIRQAAMKLRETGQGSEPVVRSANKEIDLLSEASPAAKLKKKASISEVKLPEKYELLDEFFSGMDSSIRLLQLKRSATTFTNISAQVESLTDRRFMHSHLAQLKFIMPEAIVLEKVLTHDERTSCMKPDLRVTLNIEAIETPKKSKSESRNLVLRKVFRSRLLDFHKSHPEEEDVPEGELPEPFCQSKANITTKSSSTKANIIRQSISTKANLFTKSIGTPAVKIIRESITTRAVAASPLSPSFLRRFSKRGSARNLANPSVVTIHPSVDSELKSAESPSEKTANLKPSTEVKSSVCETPVKSITPAKNEDNSSTGTPVALRTPVELVSTPAKLMTATPVLQTPKRCHTSPNDDSYKSPTKLMRRPPPNRPLKFDTPVKNVKTKHESGSSRKASATDDDDILDILPESLLQSIREKEEIALMEKDPAISQAKRRQQMLGALPKLFDLIHFLFQSINRSVLTKEELIHKIISGHLDVVDRREVEEQLILLQELAPEWINKKSASSGDTLFCVNKYSSPETIRTRLAKAK